MRVIAIPRRKIWTPWDDARRKWQRFLTKFQEGKLQRDPTSGKLRRSANGKLVRNSSTSSECCCDSTYWPVYKCTGGTLTTYTIRVGSIPTPTDIAPYVFAYEGECYYIDGENEPGEDPQTQLNPANLETFDACEDCGFYQILACEDDYATGWYIPASYATSLPYYLQINGGSCFYVPFGATLQATATQVITDESGITITEVTDCNDEDCVCCGGLSFTSIQLAFANINLDAPCSSVLSISPSYSWTTGVCSDAQFGLNPGTIPACMSGTWSAFYDIHLDGSDLSSVGITADMGTVFQAEAVILDCNDGVYTFTNQDLPGQFGTGGTCTVTLS